MHDPTTVAWEIKSPFKKVSQFFPKGYRDSLITIWHVDPEKDGTDDSCGWFKRSRHGCKETLEKIRREFDYEFGQKEGDTLPRWFNADGTPRLSSIGITLQMFQRAHHTIHRSRRKTNKFITKHLADILHFAENNIDSLNTDITNRYGVEKREDRIENFAHIIYGYILRAEQPWYRHR